jgi:PKHD-type hydroxylase
VLPPRFNRYTGAGSYGAHIDNAIFSVPGTPLRVRGDLSATLFFSDPDEYDGGELMIEGEFGRHSVKLPAGHMVVYPASTIHQVTPVTRGVRLAAFFWIQSLVREATAAPCCSISTIRFRRLRRRGPMTCGGAIDRALS